MPLPHARKRLQMEPLEPRYVPHAISGVGVDHDGDEPLLAATAVTRASIGVVRPTSDGQLIASLDSNGNGTFDATDAVSVFGQPGDQVLVGDWAGNGFDTIGVARDNAGAKQILIDSNGNGTLDSGDSSFNYGLAGDRVVTGDWNNDGRTDVGVVRGQPTGAAIFVLDSNGNYQADPADQSFIFGAAGDQFLIGDWTGDGRPKVGVVRPDPGTGLAVFSLDSNGNAQFDPSDAVFRFGLASDTFVIGDWGGTGRANIGVVRNDGQGVALFSLDSNGNGQYDPGVDSVFQFGLASDTFLIGHWHSPATASAEAVVPDQTTSAPEPAPGPAAPIPAPALNTLTAADIPALRQAAIEMWKAAGLDANKVKILVNTDIQITPMSVLGTGSSVYNDAGIVSSKIKLDPTANGIGWYIDRTPLNKSEFSKSTPTGYVATPGTDAGDHVDLLTVLMHEMGHVLGIFDHSPDAGNLMYSLQLPGVRHLPTPQNVAAVNASTIWHPAS